MRIRLDLSFRVVFSRICGGRIQSDWGRIQLGLRVKFQSRRWTFSMGVLRNPMGVLKRVNGSIGQGQWWHWSGSMGVLKRVNWRPWSGSMVALVRVNGGIEKGQLEALVRVNGGIGQGQWGY